MKKLIACEIGNFDAKLIGEAYIKALDKRDEEKKEHEKVINVLNIVSEGRNRRRYGDKKANPLNLLDVTIETPSELAANGRFFVGGLAFAEGGATKLKPTSEDKKSKNPLTIIEMLTTIGYYLYLEDPSNPERTERIDLSTCLPTEEFFDYDEDHVMRLHDKLRGTHTIQFNDRDFNGAKITIDIDEILINPEGTTAQMASTYDWDGEILPDMEGHEHKTIINIDIGSIDVNVSILSNGEFMDGGFFGIKGGTTKVLRKIGMEIQNDFKLDYIPDPHKIDYHLRTGHPFYVGDEEVKDLKDRGNKAYALEALFLSNNISMNLKDRGIEKNEINTCNMTGGGTRWMKTEFENNFKTKHMKVQSPKNPRCANVEGAYKALVMNKLDSEAVNEEIFSEA